MSAVAAAFAGSGHGGTGTVSDPRQHARQRRAVALVAGHSRFPIPMRPGSDDLSSLVIAGSHVLRSAVGSAATRDAEETLDSERRRGC
jgi:hypothetical protein